MAHSLPAALLAALALLPVASAQEAQDSDKAYLLRYRFAIGEEIATQITHVASTETKIRGSKQVSRSRSVSTKLWRIKDVDADGNITFEHLVSAVDMWQKVTGRPEVRYNSQTDEEAPLPYKAAADSIGQVMADVKISPRGEILERKSNVPEFDIGLGPIALPLPEGEIKVGERWHLPTETLVRMRDETVKRVKTRQTFQLLSVKTGVARIKVETQVLTPIKDPQVKAYLVQQLTNGEVRFDVDLGRVISKEIDWDETVLGFSGADSMMEYLARYTEEPPARKTALSPAETR